MQYKYIGTEPKHWPTLGVFTNPGDVFETEIGATHPELEIVEEKIEPKTKK